MSVSARRDLVILACAISAGVHGALARSHFSEGAGAGGSFVAAAVMLGAFAVVLTWRPSKPVVAGAALTFAGLLASYVFATTTGLPLLHPEPEPVDGVALATKAVETAGLLAASTLLGRHRGVAPSLPHPKGTLT